MSQLRIQDARAVAYRALCLGALLKRRQLELSVQNLDAWSVFDGVREQFVKQQTDINEAIQHWLVTERITPHLSETEQHLLNRPLGSWSDKTLVTVGWRTESLGMMLWTLNRFDSIPTYDTQFDLDQILYPLDLLQPTIDFIWLAGLRSEYELSTARDQAEVWNWRSRARELQRMGVRPPEGVTFQEIIRFTAERAYNEGHIDQPIDGDFPVNGRSYARLDADESNLVSSLAYERNCALSWICEITSEWESIRIDK